jgi:hypothetical protein
VSFIFLPINSVPGSASGLLGFWPLALGCLALSLWNVVIADYLIYYAPN